MATTTLRAVRIGLWVAVAVAAIAATVLFLVVRIPAPGAGGIGVGSYSLTSADGASFTEASLKGEPSLLFFGYTHCPDVCPTTLAEMETWYQALGESGKDLRAWFVTVDPARDTPEIVGDYVSWLGGKVVAITGSQAEIDKMVKAWGVTAIKEPGEPDRYEVSHTASVFLVNAEGGFEGTIGYGEDKDTALAKIRRLLDEQS